MNKEDYITKKLEIYRRIIKSDFFNPLSLENKNMCSECGGSCCSRYPCSFSPDDFIDVDDIDYMKKILDTGFFIIDTYFSYNPNDRVRYIRLRGSKDKNTYICNDYISRNECIAHCEGCIFDVYTRPTGGVLLIPKSDNSKYSMCESAYSFEDKKDDWRKHQDTLNELISIYENKKYCMPKISKIYKLEKILINEE